jgi:hypothetical protein
MHLPEMEPRRISKRVHLNVSLTIYEGKLDEFQAVAREMVEETRKECGTLPYEFYLSGDGKHCQLIETYLDRDAPDGAPCWPGGAQRGVPKILKTARVARFQVYGDPGNKGKDVLTGFGAEIYSYWHGLERQ